MPAGTPRSAAGSRQQLIEIALPAFTERGYDAVTVDRLSDQAELSKRSCSNGASFRYFDGKEDLALTPLNDVWRLLITDLDTVLGGSGLLCESLAAAPDALAIGLP